MQAQEVSQLVKQFDMMTPFMQSLAGKGLGGRLQAIRQLQQSGALDPGGRIQKVKKGTGKRLTSQERARLKKLREKELRRRRRHGDNSPE